MFSYVPTVFHRHRSEKKKDVRDGPDKGPYLVVVDENGGEQKKCTIFKTRVGNLRHLIALSTFISRLE